ncbi:MAG: hypothetical protein HY689_02145 [Chloroflexi bacterium]|nr:hypothetical protein [Chloroflexota bacterium]
MKDWSPETSVVVVEGEKSADALMQVGIPAVGTVTGAKVTPGPEALQALTGRDVVLWPDNDLPGREHMARIAERLRGVARSVRRFTWEDAPEKADAYDYLQEHSDAAALGAALAAAPPWEPASDGPLRPVIRTDGRFLRDITADAVAALVAANTPEPFIFRRGSALVRLRDGQAEPLHAAALGGILERVADFVKGEAGTPSRVGQPVVLDITTQPDLPLPELRGVCGVPVVLPGGRVLAQAGYDPDSGLYLDLRDLQDVRHDMSLADARCLLLDELLRDFPFDSDASRAHAVALLLQPFVRPMIAGPTPLYLIEAPARGTGKGLLADLVAVVSRGAPAHAMALPRDDDETEKRITSTLLAGYPLIILDNVTVLRAAPLAVVLTTTLWRGRRLGQSEIVSAPNTATWVATGNNPQLSDELTRRAVSIRLDAGVEAPEERTGWHHPDLLGWAESHRKDLVSACLAIVRHWLDAGCPEPSGVPTLGRFESWRAVMGGILQAVGIPGFLENRAGLRNRADASSQEWATFCAAWWEAHGSRPVTAGDLLAVAKDRGLLLDVWAGRSALGGQQRLGHALADRRDRVFGTFRVRAVGPARSGGAAYVLEQYQSAGGASKTLRTPQTPRGVPSDASEDAGFSASDPPKPRGDEPKPRGGSGTEAGVCRVFGVSGPGQPDAGGWEEV